MHGDSSPLSVAEGEGTGTCGSGHTMGNLNSKLGIGNH